MGEAVKDGDRFLLVRCEAPGAEHLAIIWDKRVEDFLDVIDLQEAPKYLPEDEL